MTTKRRQRIFGWALAAVAAAAISGCGGNGKGGDAPATTAAGAAGDRSAPAVEPPPPPYTYPAPVSGPFEDVNTGTFELVDGIAFPGFGGTVVHVTSKAIASPLVAASACPMTEARAVSLVRNAGYVEAPIDGDGRSAYFAHGSPYGGRSREENVGGRYWKMTRSAGPAERIAGKMVYRGKCDLTFDLPLSRPSVAQFSDGERSKGARHDASATLPSGERLVATYKSVAAAVRARDWQAMLVASGLSAELARAIRGLPGIDADFAAHADRFLTPGDLDDPNLDGAYFGVMGRGANSKGEKFANFYMFELCGDRLILTEIGENPQ